VISTGLGNPAQLVAVVGAGGHAKVVVGTLQAIGRCALVAYDDDPVKSGGTVLGVAVRGPVALLREAAHSQAVLAIGDNATRQRLAGELSGFEWTRAVHPGAEVHDSVRVAPGAVVLAGAVLQPEVSLGSHTIVNTGALIDHDCVVGDFAHVCPGAILAGQVTVGEGSLIGAGAVLIPGVRVGDWAVVGAGSVVIRDVPAGVTVAGNPARRL